MGPAISAPLLELAGISVVRDGRTILDNLSLTVSEGQHTVILGPNGCGKSTLIKVLLREIYPYGGQGVVRVCGQDRWVISELRTMIGVVSEEPRTGLLGSPTGLDMAVSGLLGTYGVTAQYRVTSSMWDLARAALVRVHAERLASQPLETMSTGERRRCWIARAMVSSPRALVLDEPTTGLDMKAAYEFHHIVEGLAQSGVTVILVTHHLEEIVPSIRRVILMGKGCVLEDGDRDSVLNLENLRRTFGIEDPHLIRVVEENLTSLPGLLALT